MTENELKVVKLNLFDNTFGAVVNIAGPIHKLLMIANNPINYLNLANREMINNSSTIIATFNKSETGSILKYEIDEDSAFGVVISEGIFIQDKILTIEIVNREAQIKECVLCFPHMMGLTGQKDINGLDIVPSTIQRIKELWELDVVDLTGTTVQYEGLDDLIKGYHKAKNRPTLGVMM